MPLIGCRRLRELGRVGEARGEVGFPAEFGGVAEEPVAAVLDGGFDLGDSLDGSFAVAQPGAAPLKLGGGRNPFLP